jgi:hypothetical protein
MILSCGRGFCTVVNKFTIILNRNIFPQLYIYCKCVIIIRHKEGYGWSVSPPSNTVRYHVEKIGRTSAILEGLEPSNFPQTKSGRSIPRSMAQFAGITCLEMWDLCPGLF